MYMTGQLSVSTPFAVGDLGSEHNEHRDSHAEPVSVELSEIEVRTAPERSRRTTIRSVQQCRVQTALYLAAPND